MTRTRLSYAPEDAPIPTAGRYLRTGSGPPYTPTPSYRSGQCGGWPSTPFMRCATTSWTSAVSWHRPPRGGRSVPERRLGGTGPLRDHLAMVIVSGAIYVDGVDWGSYVHTTAEKPEFRCPSAGRLFRALIIRSRSLAQAALSSAILL